MLQTLLIILLPLTVVAQSDDQWPPLDYLRSDYRSVQAVAQVRVNKAEIVNRVGGYEDWRVVCTVVEPFKGKFRRGQEVVYFQGAEAGLQEAWFNEDKIVFLLHSYRRKEKTWIYSVLENSTLPVTADRLAKLRRIKQTTQRKKSPPRRGQLPLTLQH